MQRICICPQPRVIQDIFWERQALSRELQQCLHSTKEGIITVKALVEGFIPPTIHYSVPDEECDLNIVPNVGIENDMEYAMSNSLGFGGHNASLVFRKV